MPNPENLKGKGFDNHPENINKNGRPSLKPLIEVLNKITDGKPDDATEEALKELRKLVTKGNINAIQYFLDKFFGKPHQSTDITSDGDKIDTGGIHVIYGKDKD